MAVFEGTQGNDTIDGFNSQHWGYVDGQLVLYPNGNDTINGYGGDDLLQGRGGNDDIFGGDRNDFIGGGDGRDELHGEFGDDSIRGGSDRDSMYGGQGNDFLDGDSGNDQIFGNDGQDVAFGDIGDDTVSGGNDGDLVVGSVGNDLVEGDGGDDTVEGGADKDTLTGGTGDDILIGGGDSLITSRFLSVPDRDNMQDIFKITGEENGGFGNDTVRGFEPNLDKIELGFDIVLNFTKNPPPNDSVLKNFELLDYSPSGIVEGSDGELTDEDFPFVERVGNDLLINFPPSGHLVLDSQGVQEGTIEYQMNGQMFNYGGGSLLIKNVDSLDEDDFIFAGEGLFFTIDENLVNTEEIDDLTNPSPGQWEDPNASSSNDEGDLGLGLGIGGGFSTIEGVAQDPPQYDSGDGGTSGGTSGGGTGGDDGGSDDLGTKPPPVPPLTEDISGTIRLQDEFQADLSTLLPDFASFTTDFNFG